MLPTLAANGDVPQPTSGTKVCTVCGREKAVKLFRRRRKGSDARQAVCNPCFAAETRERRQAKRATSIDQFAAKLSALRQDSRIALLVTRMLRRFGGVEGLSREWYATIETSTPSTRAKSCLAILRLMEYTWTVAPPEPEPDYDDMDDDELRLTWLITLDEMLEAHGLELTNLAAELAEFRARRGRAPT